MEALRAGLWKVRGLVPAMLAVPTIVLYWVAASPDGGQAAAGSRMWVVLAGAGIGAVIYGLFGYLSASTTTASTANRSLYQEQRSRLGSIAKAVEILKPSDPSNKEDELAWEQAWANCQRVQEALDSPTASVGWASGERYAGLWAEIHRAEEGLLRLRSVETIRADAEIDVQRLARSRIAGWESLKEMLENAIKGLARADDREQVSATIRAVRQAINEYRDDRGMGLVRLRYSLRRWQLMLGLVAYVLFVAAILSVDPDRFLVQSFAVYFLVGAAVGLMHEAWKRRQNRPIVEDYGVSQARFLLVPLLSGTAACGGVFLAGLLVGNPLGDLLAAASGIDYSRLSLQANPALVVVAGVFGLAPGRFLGALEALGDRLESEISASEPTGAADSDY
jgi:hypothetical protein